MILHNIKQRMLYKAGSTRTQYNMVEDNRKFITREISPNLNLENRYDK